MKPIKLAKTLWITTTGASANQVTNLYWMGVLEESLLLWLGIATEICWICLQHLIEAQLVLCSYCGAIHLGIYVLQELVSGMNHFANFIVYPYLVPNDTFERGLISVEILPMTTQLAVVEWETGFVPPSIEALIRTKTIVGITNEVDILGDHRAVDADVACFSGLFTHYSGIDHFEMIEDNPERSKN
jgi:hypothetical protein